MIGFTVCVSVRAVTVKVENATAFTMHVRWHFVGSSAEQLIPANEVKSVSKLLLHKGFQDVYATGVHVGDVWGQDPDTGADLHITEHMVNEQGQLRGLQPADLYSAPFGQAVYTHFLLFIEPVKNEKDPNSWWPRLNIIRKDKDIFVGIKDSVVDFGNTLAKYGSEGVAVANALATKKPITGFSLTNPPVYVEQSMQESPLSIAQEKASLEARIKNLEEHNSKKGAFFEDGESIVIVGGDSTSDIGSKSDIDNNNKSDSVTPYIAQYKEELAILDAISKYRPIFYLHPDDLAGPVDPRDFFAGQTTAVREKTPNAGMASFVIPVGQVTFEKLSDLISKNSGKHYYIWHGMSAKPETYDTRILYGSNPDHYKEKAIPIHVVTFYDKVKEGVDAVGRPIYKTDKDGYFVPNKEHFYIQYLCLYSYNQPYDIRVPAGTIYKGDARDFQNAHEGDLEHITMKVEAQTGRLVAIYYGAHGSDEGMWMYPPGSGNSGNEFTLEDGRPVVFSAFGGHGHYPKDGVYTRVYGFANDITKKGPLWKLTENNIYRTVLKDSAGFNPLIHTKQAGHFGYLDFVGDLGPRGISAFIQKPWAGNSENEDKGRDASEVHARYFCPEVNLDAACLRNKSKASPPPGDKRPWYIEMLQGLGVL